eukprot:503269-Rhodomonas_salina.3
MNRKTLRRAQVGLGRDFLLLERKHEGAEGGKGGSAHAVDSLDVFDLPLTITIRPHQHLAPTINTRCDQDPDAIIITRSE